MSLKYNLNLDFKADVASHLKSRFPDMESFRILSKSLDARGANRGKRPRYLYTVEVIKSGEVFDQVETHFLKLPRFKKPPVIIGAGPAGLFCALRFAEYGIPTIILERGGPAQERMKKISKFWRYGELDPEDNVCYGEGGAGLFSDGKLITRVKSPHIKYVMKKFVEFGAPEETAYISNPHLGSNKIRSLISSIGEFLKENGHVIHYHSKVDEILFDEKKTKGIKLSNGKMIETDHVILATGHSAGDMYEHLSKKDVAMKAKDFSIGVRIEHRRKTIDQIQYGKFSTSSELGTARYRLSYHDKLSDRGTYSFCMCPGGYVLSSGTEGDGIVVNGMSNFSRRSPWSNSALVVSVKAGVDFDAKDDVLSGLRFQRHIEKKAYEFSLKHATGREIPAQNLMNFMNGVKGFSPNTKTSCPSKLVPASLDEILPDFITNHLKEALNNFNEKMHGFLDSDALLLAPETRTSAPITLLRHKETLESLSHKGLYPAGEGAGHAGGITSAAVDGIRIAESIISEIV